MKLLTALSFLITTFAHAHASPLLPRTIQGLTLSHHTPSPNLTSAHTVGLTFTFLSATSGATYTDPLFTTHLAAAHAHGFLVSAVHVARPERSAASTQASFFLANGGAWNNDSATLPGTLALGVGPDAPTGCGGLNPKDTVDWIRDFVDAYKAASERYPIIATKNEWWVECAGNSGEWMGKSKLALVKWGENVGMVPGGWRVVDFWGYQEKGAWGGEGWLFGGGRRELEGLLGSE